jgi:serine/threonine-protein kinase HipA
MNPLLNIYFNERHIAILWLEDKYFNFQYITQDTQPISLSLPVRAEPYVKDFAKPYFANLLPEGETRTLIETRLGISRGDDFELLKQIGGDCAGAVTLFPEDQTPFENAAYTALSEVELVSLIKNLPQTPLCVGLSKKIRLSLPGAQNKTTLYVKDGVYYLPENGAPSSHILKIPITSIKGITDTVQNETFVMMLAKEVGLNVPAVDMVQIGDVPVFIIERYDRRVDENQKLQRLLQEDFCQLYRLEPTVKYQNAGGPSLEDCAEKIREHSSNSVTDIEQLLKWAAFNVIVGNADAHGKNLSILWGDDGIRLAPFYDILSTTVYGIHDDDFAMSIGRQFKTEKLTRDNWKQLADFLDINIRLIDKINSDLVDTIEPSVNKIMDTFEIKYGVNVTVEKIIKDIGIRTKLLVK